MRCLICGGDEFKDIGEGLLDQSGLTFLPARVIQCMGARCFDTFITLQTGERWQAREEANADTTR